MFWVKVENVLENGSHRDGALMHLNPVPSIPDLTPLDLQCGWVKHTNTVKAVCYRLAQWALSFAVHSSPKPNPVSASEAVESMSLWMLVRSPVPAFSTWNLPLSSQKSPKVAKLQKKNDDALKTDDITLSCFCFGWMLGLFQPSIFSSESVLFQCIFRLNFLGELGKTLFWRRCRMSLSVLGTRLSLPKLQNLTDIEWWKCEK